LQHFLVQSDGCGAVALLFEAVEASFAARGVLAAEGAHAFHGVRGREDLHVELLGGLENGLPNDLGGAEMETIFKLIDEHAALGEVGDGNDERQGPADAVAHDVDRDQLAEAGIAIDQVVGADDDVGDGSVNLFQHLHNLFDLF